MNPYSEVHRYLAEDYNNFFIPIIVGTIGHRDIEKHDIQELGQKVEQVLLEIKNNYTNSPIILLSSLAEGADRIVAKLAFSLGIKVIAPLPMPIIEYEKDFQSEFSKEEFRELLNKTYKYIELPFIEDNNPNNIGNIDHRNKQYAFVGTYISNRSHIMLALWDGLESKLKGGTSFAINYRLKHTPEIFLQPKKSSLSYIDSGPVIQIVTPRQSNPNPAHELYSIRKYFPTYWKDELKADSFYSSIFKNIDKYNLDLKKNKSLVSKGLFKNENSFIPQDEQSILNNQLKNILTRFTMADILANYFKDHRVRVLIQLLIIIIIAFFFFQIYLEFINKPLVLILYPLLLAIGSLIYIKARKNEYDFKYEDYRALAEALRVQFFWKYIGIPANTSDYYLRKHKGELEWIRYAIKACNLIEIENQNSAQQNDHLKLADKNKFAFKYWIRNQLDWFLKNSHINKIKQKRFEKTGNILFLFGIALALLLFLIEILNDKINLISYSNLILFKHLIVVSIAMVLTCSAAIHGYNEKMLFAEQAKQYNRMYNLYNFVYEKIESLIIESNQSIINELFFELGKEALIENGDWLLLHRSRPLEMPKG